MTQTQEKYLLWASTKGYHHNYPVFWGKGNCGYYSALEDCEIYTKEEAFSHANEDTIPVKLSDLEEYKRTTFLNCQSVLYKAQKDLPDKYKRLPA